MLKTNRVKSQAGFSLIELMIVVAIIGVLAAIAVPNFTKFQMKSKQAEGKGYLGAMFTGEKSYYAEWDSYTNCMDHIGFDREGASARYSAGSSTGGRVAGANDTVTACVPLRGATAPTGAVVTGGAGGAFELGAVAPANALGNGSTLDEWHVNQVKPITQTANGIP